MCTESFYTACLLGILHQNFSAILFKFLFLTYMVIWKCTSGSADSSVEGTPTGSLAEGRGRAVQTKPCAFQKIDSIIILYVQCCSYNSLPPFWHCGINNFEFSEEKYEILYTSHIFTSIVLDCCSALSIQSRNRTNQAKIVPVT